MFYDNDTATFFNTSDFGISATYTAAGKASAAVNVQFFDEHEQLVLGDVEVDAKGPYLMAAASDIPDVAKGDLFEISGTLYSVTEAHEETGVSVVMLSRQW